MCLKNASNCTYDMQDSIKPLMKSPNCAYLGYKGQHQTLTFADDYVTLEVNPVALRELEHGVKLGLGGSLQTVVLELGQDVWIRTTGQKEKQY